MPEFSQYGKVLIIVGLLIAAVGFFLAMGGRIPFLGKLPGDIVIRGKNFSLYLPIATCLVISVVLTLIFCFFRDR